MGAEPGHGGGGAGEKAHDTCCMEQVDGVSCFHMSL